MKSKLHIAIALISLLFSINAYSQIPKWEWAYSLPGGHISNVDVPLGKNFVDAMGNIYIIGNFFGTIDFDNGPGVFNLTSAGMMDIYIVKLDNLGHFIWAKSIGGTWDDAVGFVALDISGNVYITGMPYYPIDVDPGPGVYNLSANVGRTFLLKLDSAGNFVWAKQIAEFMTSFTIAPSGNIYTTGCFRGTIDFNNGTGVFNLTATGNTLDIYVLKLNNMGNFVWAKRMGGTGDYEEPHSIALDVSENVYTTGVFKGTGDFDPGAGVFNLACAGSDCFISKLDSLGNFAWAKQLGIQGSGDGYSIAIDPSGNIYTAGRFTNSADFDPGSGTFYLTSAGIWDVFILKLDYNGNFIWAKQMGSTGEDAGMSLALDNIGNIYTTGSFGWNKSDFDPGSDVYHLRPIKLSNDVFVSKLDSSGNFIWAKSAGGNGNDIGYTVGADPVGNLYIQGRFLGDSISFGATTLSGSTLYHLYNFIAKLSPTPCNAVTCTINPKVKTEKVTNPLCSNGKITVNIGGTFQAFPHVELYDSSNSIIDSINLSPGILHHNFNNLGPGIYTVKVFDYNCCEQDITAIVHCADLTRGLQTTRITTSSAKLKWKPVTCAVSYRVQYRQQGVATWNNRYVNGSSGYRAIVNLNASTAYEWRVANMCTGLTTYPLYTYSPIQTFTTLDAPRAGEELNSSLSENNSFDINLYPNPATYTLTVSFETENPSAQLKIVNTVGQVVLEKQLQSDEGSYETELNISGLGSGIYMVLIKTADGVSCKKFIRE